MSSSTPNAIDCTPSRPNSHSYRSLPWALLGLLGQAIILTSILRVTGIPPTEAQSLRSKGEAYRDYQRRVSKFLPMPPRQRP